MYLQELKTNQLTSLLLLDPATILCPSESLHQNTPFSGCTWRSFTDRIAQKQSEQYHTPCPPKRRSSHVSVNHMHNTEGKRQWQVQAQSVRTFIFSDALAAFTFAPQDPPLLSETPAQNTMLLQLLLRTHPTPTRSVFYSYEWKKVWKKLRWSLLMHLAHRREVRRFPQRRRRICWQAGCKNVPTPCIFSLQVYAAKSADPASRVVFL